LGVVVGRGRVDACPRIVLGDLTVRAGILLVEAPRIAIACKELIGRAVIILLSNGHRKQYQSENAGKSHFNFPSWSAIN